MCATVPFGQQLRIDNCRRRRRWREVEGGKWLDPGPPPPPAETLRSDQPTWPWNTCSHYPHLTEPTSSMQT